MNKIVPELPKIVPHNFIYLCVVEWGSFHVTWGHWRRRWRSLTKLQDNVDPTTGPRESCEPLVKSQCLLLPELAAVVSCHLTWDQIRGFAWQIRISHQEVKPKSQTGFIKDPRSWHAGQCGPPWTLPALLKADAMKAETWYISADQVWSLKSPEEAPLERRFK